MKKIFISCKYCGGKEKAYVDEEDFQLVEEGATLSCMCEFCFESYQAKGAPGLAARSQAQLDRMVGFSNVPLSEHHDD